MCFKYTALTADYFPSLCFRKKVSVRCHLNQGCYVLLPTTFEPFQEANYTLRVLSTKPMRMKLLDFIPSLMKPAIIQAPITQDKVSSYEAVFLRLADEHKTISAFELLELLETCLPNGKSLKYLD